MTFRMLRLGAVALPLLASCAHHPKLVTAPANAWREYATAHFSVITDLPESDARARLAVLEQMRAGVLSSFPEGTYLDRISVIAPKTAAELQDLLPDHGALAQEDEPAVRGLSYQDWFHEPRLVLPGQKSPSDCAEAATLMASLAARASLRRRPQWVHDGLPTFFSTLQVRDDGAVETGRAPREFLERIQKFWPPVSLVSIGWPQAELSTEMDRHAPEAQWALVHWAVHTHPDAFRKYLSELMDGQEPKAAWQNAFPGVGADDLISQVSAYIKDGRIARPMLHLSSAPSTTPPVSASDVSLAEMKALFAEVRTHWYEESLAGFGGQLDELVTELPDNPVALSLLSGLSTKPEERLARTKAAAARHPEDWRLQMLAWDDLWRTRAQRGTIAVWANSLYLNTLSYVAEGPPPPDAEMDALLDRAAQLAPDRPVVQMALAASLLARRDGPGSLRAGMQALRAYPAAPRVADLVARAMMATGQCSAAIRLGEQAIAIHHDAEDNGFERHKARLPGAVDVDLQDKLDRHLAAYRSACAGR